MDCLVSNVYFKKYISEIMHYETIACVLFPSLVQN